MSPFVGVLEIRCQDSVSTTEKKNLDILVLCNIDPAHPPNGISLKFQTVTLFRVSCKCCGKKRKRNQSTTDGVVSTGRGEKSAVLDVKRCSNLIIARSAAFNRAMRSFRGCFRGWGMTLTEMESPQLAARPLQILVPSVNEHHVLVHQRSVPSSTLRCANP